MKKYNNENTQKDHFLPNREIRTGSNAEAESRCEKYNFKGASPSQNTG